MEDMNVHNVDYMDNHLTIKVVGKKELCNIDLSVLSVILNKNEHSIDLGLFYTKLPQMVSEKYMKKFVKRLIDNIDKIIFENNRYIGEESSIIENLNTNMIDSTLAEIYSEFLEKTKNSKGFIKYSRFLELYFHGHSIPDSIKKIYLNITSKSILDVINIDEVIKSEFSGNIKDLKDEDEKERDIKRLELLNEELELKQNEINMLKSMIDEVDTLLNLIAENENINSSIDELESKLKEISFFSKSRKEIKGTLKNLENSIKLVDIDKKRNEIFELYSHYASIYKDTRGLLVLFDNLTLEDILSLLKDIYRVKEISFNGLNKKIDNLNYKLLNYNNETIDISDLYERLESK